MPGRGAAKVRVECGGGSSDQEFRVIIDQEVVTPHRHGAVRDQLVEPGAIDDGRTRIPAVLAAYPRQSHAR